LAANLLHDVERGLPRDPKLIAVWVSGFKHAKRGDTLVDIEKLDADAEKLRKFCISNPDMPVMEAVEKAVGKPE
jgi:hypothetical protein